MKTIKIFVASVLAIFSLNLVSCSMFVPEKGSFYGGKILDNKVMEELRQEFLESETQTASETDSIGKINSEAQAESTSTSIINSEANTETESTDEISSKPQHETHTEETENNQEMSDTVYWAKSGSVWHLFRDCGYLKNSKEIKSGSIEEAIASGAQKMCSSCEKKKEN